MFRPNPNKGLAPGEPGLRSGQNRTRALTLETPNDCLFPPGQPERFRSTQEGREDLGPRFARQGIGIDASRTADDIEEAIARVAQAEYAEPTPARQADRGCLNRLFDLQFVIDPPQGVPPESLEIGREAGNPVVRSLAQRWREGTANRLRWDYGRLEPPAGAGPFRRAAGPGARRACDRESGVVGSDPDAGAPRLARLADRPSCGWPCAATPHPSGC